MPVLDFFQNHIAGMTGWYAQSKFAMHHLSAGEEVFLPPASIMFLQWFVEYSD